MKILIACSSTPLSSSVMDELKARHTVICCDEGRNALKHIRQWQPDILLLDLTLAGIDGLSLLQAIEFSVLKPKILVITDYLSDYIYSVLHSLSVEYILQKPITICAAMTQLNTMICTCEKQESDNRYRKLHQLMHVLSFRRCCSGYDCVLEALYQVLYRGQKMMTKEIYPEVAKICGGTPARVEKAIRDAIYDAWSRRDNDIWELYFPANRVGDIPCPSNTQFLLSFFDSDISMESKTAFA